MGFKVTFAPQAIERLEEIVRYIAEDDPIAAETFGLHLVDYSDILCNFPELGRPYRKRPDVRRLFCKPYWIYYRVREGKRLVEIMDFWHSARLDPEI